jgi:hypothetical protein
LFILFSIIGQSVAAGVGGILGLVLFVFLMIFMYGGGNLSTSFDNAGTFFHTLLILILLTLILSTVVGTLVMLIKQLNQNIAPHYLIANHHFLSKTSKRINNLQKIP